MRGTLADWSGHMDVMGIIPADAGNTPNPPVIRSSSKDHPRGCGEHGNPERGQPFGHGSSPRMRGTHFAVRSSGISIRIIPADAGNTPQTTPYQDWSGSSPRMRGTPSTASCMTSGSGIIPADAGNTKYQLFCTRPREDHPRGCGEHYRHAMSKGMASGSSPRMRGTHPASSYPSWRRRIIPADAGNTRHLGGP